MAAYLYAPTPLPPPLAATLPAPVPFGPRASDPAYFRIGMPGQQILDDGSCTIPGYDARNPIYPRTPARRESFFDTHPDRGGALCIGKLPQPPIYIAGIPLQSPSLESDIMRSTPGRLTLPQEGSNLLAAMHDGAGGSMPHPRQLIHSTLAYRLLSISPRESERQEYFTYQKTLNFEKLQAKVIQGYSSKDIVALHRLRMPQRVQ